MEPKLVNKDYFDSLDKKAKAHANPTVGDVMEIMRKEGNLPYYYAFNSHFSTRTKSPTLRKDGTISHEVSHIAPRLGHTPMQEMLVAEFEFGLIGIQNLSGKGTMKERYQKNKNFRYGVIDDYSAKELPEISLRHRSIYYAAGAYLREKILNYAANGMDLANYGDQKPHCTDYAKPEKDKEFIKEPIQSPEWSIVKNAPYELIKISPKEWRAIESVATGLYEPERTDYPNRMKRVKDKLDEVGLGYDLKSKFIKSSNTSAIAR